MEIYDSHNSLCMVIEPGMTDEYKHLYKNLETLFQIKNGEWTKYVIWTERWTVKMSPPRVTGNLQEVQREGRSPKAQSKMLDY